MSSETFASVPWTATVEESSGTTTGWHKHRVPYLPGATYLQTLDLWVPAAATGSTQSAPAPDTVPSAPGPWVVYLHGGAWRDPLVDASSFAATAQHLLHAAAATPGPPRFAGLASINYRLSPHPHHPTQPAPPADPAQAPDPARLARHPDHLVDVLTALAYLQRGRDDGGLGIVLPNYVLAGHSCGATLAFQVAMDRARFGLGVDVPAVLKPRVLLGLNGLYDLVQFLHAPDASHQQLMPLYTAFSRNAFGDAETTWRDVCPGVVADWSAEWPEEHTIVLVQSHEDTLVPYSQLKGMQKKLASGTATVRTLAATGDHNWLWQSGERLAEIIDCVLAEEC